MLWASLRSLPSDGLMLTYEKLSDYIDTLFGAGGDLAAFGPELVLCGVVIVMLLWRVFGDAKSHMSLIALAGTGLALWVAIGQWSAATEIGGLATKEIFSHLLVFDAFTVFIRLFLLAFTVLIIVLTMLTNIPDAEDSADFYTLLLGSVIGMSMMAAANHLLMIFVAVEMASVPSYAMAGFLKGKKQSSEAALKYVVYGGAAAGVMLYGISLLAGMFGTLHLPTLAHNMLVYFTSPGGQEFNPTLLVALVLILVGMAFKLAAFPFHFWCPDVFEGAAAEVAAFLSVASKGAAIALLARFTLTLAGTFAQAGEYAEIWQPSLEALAAYLSPVLAVIAALTATFGNLAAYGQTNLKRLLAYSTIAHAGYMMMALVPLSIDAGGELVMTTDGVKAAFFYLFIYLFMNLGAFAVVAFVRNQTGSEEIEAYTGLFYRAPWLTVAMCIFLLSLTGVPPLAGFVAKFQIFYVLYQSGWYSLLVIGSINTVISLVYYVNVMRVMILQGEPTAEPAWESVFARSYAAIIAVPVVLFGIFWNVPDAWTRISADSLTPAAPAAVAAHEPAETVVIAGKED